MKKKEKRLSLIGNRQEKNRSEKIKKVVTNNNEKFQNLYEHYHLHY